MQMYAAERQQSILSQARELGRVEVAQLADALDVTAETVRRDLTALEKRGVLRRVHGGAIAVDRLEPEPTLAARSSLHTDVKRRIAARVLEQLPSGGTVLLDAGSTTLAIVDLLPHDIELTVLTNSVPAIAPLASRAGILLFVLGGGVRGVTGAMVGDWTVDALANVVVDVAVLGTNGMSASRGFTTPDEAESRAKRAMVASARRVIVAADSSKAGDDHFHRFAAPEDVDLIITDTDMADDVAAELRVTGPEVVLA